MRRARSSELTLDTNDTGQTALDIGLVASHIGEPSTHGLAHGVDTIEQNACDQFGTGVSVRLWEGRAGYCRREGYSGGGWEFDCVRYIIGWSGAGLWFGFVHEHWALGCRIILPIMIINGFFFRRFVECKWVEFNGG
jgi:hypothetical protein